MSGAAGAVRWAVELQIHERRGPGHVVGVAANTLWAEIQSSRGLSPKTAEEVEAHVRACIDRLAVLFDPDKIDAMKASVMIHTHKEPI